MPRTGLWLRVFIGLLLAVLPPLLLLVGTLLLTESLLAAADPNLVAVLLVLGAVVWAAILAVVYARSLDDDLRSFLTLAEKGEGPADPIAGVAYRQVADALEERNRQIATLARETAAIPIDEPAERVVRAVVGATRSVTRDATWRCAVLDTGEPTSLPPGIYLGPEEPKVAAVGDLEQWAALAVAEDDVAHAEGPWGAFAIVGLAATERLRAILYAPWEGRGELSAAERAMLALVGQHAGAALEHSLLYRRVRDQADELNRLAAVQADFLRGVTHDLQTPLTSIGALATELIAGEGIPPAARQDLDTIAHQAERLRRMVAQLLISSRLEAGAYTPQIEVFALRPLLERTWAALRAERPFSVAVAGSPHLAIGDPGRVEQVLWALLDNAVKYSPPGTPVEVAIIQRDGAIEVAIRDHGIGMDDETQDHAFDQFYRSERARQLAPDGSGVGLYAARGLVDAMGGALRVASGLGEGSTVTLRLPAEPADQNE